MLCGISDNGEENDSDELLADNSVCGQPTDGVYQKLCGNSDELRRSSTFTFVIRSAYNQQTYYGDDSQESDRHRNAHLRLLGFVFK